MFVLVLVRYAKDPGEVDRTVTVFPLEPVSVRFVIVAVEPALKYTVAALANPDPLIVRRVAVKLEANVTPPPEVLESIRTANVWPAGFIVWAAAPTSVSVLPLAVKLPPLAAHPPPSVIA